MAPTAGFSTAYAAALRSKVAISKDCRLKDIAAPQRVYRSRVSPAAGAHVDHHVPGFSLLEAE